MLQRVAVYCASSRQADALHREVARRLGAHLAGEGLSVVYGGGAVGSMGALADGALHAGGQVIGVLPRFMDELEWGHPRVSELRVVDDMHQRKRTMLELADAVVALSGGCGTLEELLEAMAWKRLGLWSGPILVVNTGGFYDGLVSQLGRCVEERFMDPRHAAMWGVVREPEQVVPALREAPPWHDDPRRFAVP